VRQIKAFHLKAASSPSIRNLGFVDKWYPLECRHEPDEAKICFLGFVISGGDASPVLEFIEQALDEIAPAVFGSIVKEKSAAVAFGRDDGFDFGLGKLLANDVGIITFVCQ